MTQTEINNRYTQLCAQLGDLQLKKEQLDVAERQVRQAIQELSQVKVTSEQPEDPTPTV